MKSAVGCVAGVWLLLMFVRSGRASEVPNGPAMAGMAAMARVAKRERSGPAISIAFGHAVSLLGAQVRYDVALRPYLILSPYVGGGYSFYERLGWSGGLAGSLGRRHRLAIDVGVAPVSAEVLVLHTTRLGSRDVYAPLVAAGYEQMSDGGFFQRFTFGVGIPLSTGVTGEIGGTIPTVSLSLGWRAW